MDKTITITLSAADLGALALVISTWESAKDLGDDLSGYYVARSLEAGAAVIRRLLNESSALPVVG